MHRIQPQRPQRNPHQHRPRRPGAPIAAPAPHGPLQQTPSQRSQPQPQARPHAKSQHTQRPKARIGRQGGGQHCRIQQPTWQKCPGHTRQKATTGLRHQRLHFAPHSPPTGLQPARLLALEQHEPTPKQNGQMHARPHRTQPRGGAGQPGHLAHGPGSQRPQGAIAEQTPNVKTQPTPTRYGLVRSTTRGNQRTGRCAHDKTMGPPYEPHE